MAIKVTLGATENTQQEKPFPKLMASEGEKFVVLFTKSKCGFVVLDSDDEDIRPIGYYSENWVMNLFTDYNEPITIQNQ
mgnify:FL=1